jgi:hypothetical protein
LNEYQSINELITDVDDYIEFYNHRRFHETLAYKKPMDVYQESIKLSAPAIAAFNFSLSDASLIVFAIPTSILP